MTEEQFTGKEIDEETGLYYYGTRYLDPKYSRWLSTDPALGEYIPKAPINEEAKRYNQNLPGMGGVFNSVNLSLYHYAANNPIKIVDPNGKEGLPFQVQQQMRQYYSVNTPDKYFQPSSGKSVRRYAIWGAYAIKSGTVVEVRDFNNQSSAYGITVIIKDDNGEYVRYAHLESTNLKKGDTIKEGSLIGYMGNTGRGLGGAQKHGHISVYPKDSKNFLSSNATIDPKDYIKDGTYPFNTKMSAGGDFGTEYPNDDGSIYKHEGVDYSGQYFNVMKDWYKGLWGETIYGE